MPSPAGEWQAWGLEVRRFGWAVGVGWAWSTVDLVRGQDAPCHSHSCECLMTRLDGFMWYPTRCAARG